MQLKEELPSLEGASSWINGVLTNEQLIGHHPTLVHFWSVSCEFCKQELTEINKLSDLYKDQLNVMAVHMPRLEADFDLKEVQKIVDQFQMRQSIYVDHDYQLTEAFDNKYVPAYYLFDSAGKLRHFQAGTGGFDLLSRRIKKLVELSNKNE